MKITKNFIKVFFIALLFVGFTSCSDDDSPVVVKKDYQKNIDNIASNVIVNTYKDLAGKSLTLFEEAKKFSQNRTASNLDATKQAWRTARQPWEQSEGFLFGPVDVLGIDPAIDSWPVNVVDMDNLLNDTEGVPTITEAIVDKQANEAKGFHLIEYLLWGIDGNKQVSDFTDRQIEYVVAACENLDKKTKQLYDAWRPGAGNYVDNYLKPGSDKKVKSQKNAILDFVTGMITIADEVGNAKIEDPLNGNNGAGDVTKEESRFSHNSKLDFVNNIKSISNVYYGKYNVVGEGVSHIIKKFDSELDKQFKSEISMAIQGIENIPGTFTDAIINNRASVKEAQKRVQQVQKTLETKIKPLIEKEL